MDLLLALIHLNPQRVFESGDLYFHRLSELHLVCFNVSKGFFGADIKL